MIIERRADAKRIAESKKWVLLYGRRKTGKTFLVTNFLKFDEYFFVKNNGSILTKTSESISYEAFIQVFSRALEDNKIVVVDEFHRLGKEFFDFLHFMKKSGKLILVSSTLFLSKKMFSAKSALLGLFTEIPLGLISIEDCLNALKKFNLSKKEQLEIAVLLREPIAIDYFNPKENARKTIAKIIQGSAKTIPALVGEIFFEEERELSGVYEGILRAIASGKVGSGEISNYLFSKKLIKKDDPSIIQQYLNNLSSFGIIRKIKVFSKKRFIYKLASPLSRIYYYADEKYNLSERRMQEKELNRIADELMPRIIEDNVREALAEKHGLEETIIEAKDFEIDGLLLKFKKPEIALEVKWKSLKEKEIRQIEQKLGKTQAKNKILFIPDKNKIKTKLKTMDAEGLTGKS
jgi:hypothetical protein